MLDIGFGDRGAIEELSVARAPCDDPSTLETCDECRDGGLCETALLVKRFPELADRGFAAIPEQAEDGELQLGDLMTFRHRGSVVIYSCRFTAVEEPCQESLPVFGIFLLLLPRADSFRSRARKRRTTARSIASR